MNRIEILISEYERVLLLVLLPEGHSQKEIFVAYDAETTNKSNQTIQYTFKTKRWTVKPHGTEGVGLLSLWMFVKSKTHEEAVGEIYKLLGEDPVEHSQKQPKQQSTSPLDFKQVAKASLSDALGIVQSLLPNGKRQGGEYVALNPKRADRKLGSFRINLQTGKWADFAIGKTGGDLISLWAYLKDTSQLKAAQELGARYSLLE